METTQEFKPEIADIYTGGNWLFVNDALEIGKLKLVAGSKDGTKVIAYVDADKAYPAIYDLGRSGALSPRTYPNHRAAWYGGSMGDSVVSRIIQFEIDQREERTHPVIIKVSTGPGVKNKQGGIMPKKGAERSEVCLFLTIEQARYFFSTIRFAVEAWMMCQRPTKERKNGTKRPDLHSQSEAEVEEEMTEPEEVETIPGTIGKEQAVILWNAAKQSMFTKEGFREALSLIFEDQGIDRPEHIPQDNFEELLEVFSNPINSAPWNCAGEEYDIHEDVPKNEWRRMWGMASAVCDVLDWDWEEKRPIYVEWVTGGRSNSSSDLCAFEVEQINYAFAKILNEAGVEWGKQEEKKKLVPKGMME